uniref:F-box domain-containing protein n=1 Tax=Strongyloides venezuelensis TaxID=75913 RepID=A0A0K0FKC7_STRVS
MVLPKKRRLSNRSKETRINILKKSRNVKSKNLGKKKSLTSKKKEGKSNPRSYVKKRKRTIIKRNPRRDIVPKTNKGKFCILNSSEINNIKTILFHKPIVSKIAYNLTSPKDRLYFSLVNKIIYDSIKDVPFVGTRVLDNRRLLIEVYATSINSAGGSISVSIANVSRKFIFFDSYASDGNFAKMLKFLKFFRNQVHQICIERKVTNGKFHNFIEIGWLPLILKHINKENFPNLDILSFCYVSFKNTGYGSYGYLPIAKVCFHECEFGDESPFIFPKKMDQLYYDSVNNIPVKLLSNIDVIEKGAGECKYSLSSVESYNTFVNFIQQSNVFEIEGQLTMNMLNFQTVFLKDHIYEFIELRIDNGKTIKVLSNLKHLLSLKLEYLKELILVFVKTPIVFSSEFVLTLCEILEKAKNLKILRFCGDYRQRVKFSEYDSEEKIFGSISNTVNVLEVSVGNWQTIRGMSCLANRLTNLELIILNSIIYPSFDIPTIFHIFKNVRNFVISFVEKHSGEIAHQWIVEFLNPRNINDSIRIFDSLIVSISGEKFYNSIVDVIKGRTSELCNQVDLSLLENGICEFSVCWKTQNLRKVRRFTDTRCRHCCAGEENKILTSLRKK